MSDRHVSSHLLRSALADLDGTPVRALDLRRRHRIEPAHAIRLCAALASRGVLVADGRAGGVSIRYRVDPAQLARAREWWAGIPSARSVAQSRRRERERAGRARPRRGAITPPPEDTRP